MVWNEIFFLKKKGYDAESEGAELTVGSGAPRLAAAARDDAVGEGVERVDAAAVLAAQRRQTEEPGGAQPRPHGALHRDLRDPVDAAQVSAVGVALIVVLVVVDSASLFAAFKTPHHLFFPDHITSSFALSLFVRSIKAPRIMVIIYILRSHLGRI